MIIVSPFVSRAEELLDISNGDRDVPCVERLRPKSCPLCGALAHVFGEPLGIVGHGFFVRKVRGIGPPGTVLSIRIRRYRCKTCDSTISVLPAQLHPRQRYTADAIFEALRGHLVEGKPAREVRRQATGKTSTSASWRTLHRWRSNLLFRLWGWFAKRSGASGPARTRHEARRRLAQLATERGLLLACPPADFSLAGTVHSGGYCWQVDHSAPEELEREYLRERVKEHPHSMSARRDLCQFEWSRTPKTAVIRCA